MPGNSDQNDVTPLFLRSLQSEIPEIFAEVPTSELPAGVSQLLIDTLADQTKSDGDKLYREGKWEDARDVYKYGAGLRPSNSDVHKATLLNLAASSLQLGDWHAVIRAASWILKMDPSSVKALYRAARALAKIACFPEALDCCDRALRLEPHNQSLQKEHRMAQQEVINIQQSLLLKAYKHHHLLVVPSSDDRRFGPSIASCHLPYFDPPIPKNPFEATLFCNLNISYPERWAADAINDFPFDKPILPLLDALLPGRTPSKTLTSTRYNLVFTSNPYLEPLKNSDGFHPIIWDPKYEFTPSKLLMYALTRRKAVIPITGEMTLVDVCAEARRMSLNSSNQSDPYTEDGQHIEVEDGIILISAVRQGSKEQHVFGNQLFSEHLVDSADSGDSVIDRVEVGSKVRVSSFGPPNKAMRDPDSLSMIARQRILQRLCKE
ncbi:hypothetical protein FRC12_002727 [Ceratobasidium sp. 428]|nr:hypothetical protein FRC12_002727 [Ceratobasidium sp. 428]